MTFTGISSRYAHALVDALLSPNAGVDAHDALSSLNEFVDAMGTSHDLELVMFSPSVPPARKRAVIQKIADAMQLNRLIRNFLFVLSDHRRLPLLRDIAGQAFVVLDERLGFLRADVSAAAPLGDEKQREIAAKLGEMTGKRIRIEMKIDPDLIGGVVARVGSTVYDGSVRGRLQLIGERLAAE